MKHWMKVAAIVVACVFCVGAAWTAQAQIDREKTLFTIGEPMAVGSQTLAPGEYRIIVKKLSENRSLVQVVNKEGTKLFAQVLATPHPVKVDETIPESRFVFYPATDTKPKALRTWFAADTATGQDIVYTKGRAEEMAVAYKEPVLAMPESTPEAAYPTVPLITVRPDMKEEPYVAAVPEPKPETKIAAKLPRTASNEPLLALAGLLAIGGALTVRALYHR